MDCGLGSNELCVLVIADWVCDDESASYRCRLLVSKSSNTASGIFDIDLPEFVYRSTYR